MSLRAQRSNLRRATCERTRRTLHCARMTHPVMAGLTRPSTRTDRQRLAPSGPIDIGQMAGFHPMRVRTSAQPKMRLLLCDGRRRPATHVLPRYKQQRRGWPASAGHDTGGIRLGLRLILMPMGSSTAMTRPIVAVSFKADRPPPAGGQLAMTDRSPAVKRRGNAIPWIAVRIAVQTCQPFRTARCFRQPREECDDIRSS